MKQRLSLQVNTMQRNQKSSKEHSIHRRPLPHRGDQEPTRRIDSTSIVWLKINGKNYYFLCTNESGFVHNVCRMAKQRNGLIDSNPSPSHFCHQDCSLWSLKSRLSRVLQHCALKECLLFQRGCFKINCYLKAVYLHRFVIYKDKCNLMCCTMESY